MMLKIQKEDGWKLIDGIRSIDYSNCETKKVNGRLIKGYTHCIISSSSFNDGQVSPEVKEYDVDCRTITYENYDGGNGSILLNATCYVCNDNGSTIEKIVSNKAASIIGA